MALEVNVLTPLFDTLNSPYFWFGAIITLYLLILADTPPSKRLRGVLHDLVGILPMVAWQIFQKQLAPLGIWSQVLYLVTTAFALWWALRKPRNKPLNP
jgi:hypothetical protein